MFTVSVSHNALKALALHAAKMDVRFYLNGICIDTTTAGRVHLVATDGHRMLVIGNAVIEGERTAGRYIVPGDVLKAAKPYAKGGPIVIEIDPKGAESGGFVIRGAVNLSGALIDGRYPEWQRTIPKERTLKNLGKPANFNFGFLGEFGRTAELLECKVPVIVQNGEGASVVLLGANAFGVIMPMRYGKVEEYAFVDWMEPVNEPVNVETQRVAA